MNRSIRTIVRLAVAAFALVVTGIGTAAYASVPPPEGTSDGFPALLPPAPVTTTLSSSTSFAQELGWMATGAAAIVLIAAVVTGIAMLFTRHRVHSHQLQLP